MLSIVPIHDFDDILPLETMTDMEMIPEIMTSTMLVPTTCVYVSTEVIDETSTATAIHLCLCLDGTAPMTLQAVTIFRTIDTSSDHVDSIALTGAVFVTAAPRNRDHPLDVLHTP